MLAVVPEELRLAVVPETAVRVCVAPGALAPFPDAAVVYFALKHVGFPTRAALQCLDRMRG